MIRVREPGPGEVEVSVIVPVYNGERYLRVCLDSLLRLDHPPERLEIICVDNASTDATPAILREFCGRIRVLHESRRGAAAARNAGIRAARGTLAAFTDADCIASPQWLTHLLPPVRNREAAVAGGRILARPGAGAVERFGELIHDHGKAIERGTPPAFISMNIAARLDLLRSLGGFDERWIRSQDSELAFRMAAAGHRFVYRPEAVIYHHNRSTVRQLCREGFIHGYYGAELYRVYRSFASHDPRPAQPPAPTDQPPALGTVPAWQRILLGKLFQASKRTGWTLGTWRPPRSLRTENR